jgi:hypothetical protein
MQASVVDEATFWPALEYRVWREMGGVDECRRRGMWCDGFIAQTVELDASPKRILGQVWVGLGPRHQEAWTFELLLPVSVTSRDGIPWSALLPGEDVTRWLTVDPDGKHLVVAPGDAVDDAA